jgi:Carboxypeptidase regulatory-like domain
MMKKLFGLMVVLFAAITLSFGQAISVSGGSIQGSITDPTGAVVPNARIAITDADTGVAKNITADSSGFYSVGPLNPGAYTVTISSPGFQTLSVKTVVRTGTATSGSFRLTLGQSSVMVEVNAGAVQVNTEQAGVSDVITKEQIQALPVNGRNFLDLAQIEPGVILQSGESFDPTKAGYSAISVGGVSGRTTRILLDGQDITDETVGTTIFNVSSGAIDEFQLNRSTQDVSGEVTSTGQVLVSTNSGTNAYHGQLFYNFQDHRALFARSQNGQDPQFQRNQFGGSIGGPILRDKLFFFANVERIKQDSSSVSPVSTGTGALFSAIAQQYPVIPTPYRLTYSTARVDYNGPFGGHYFARVNYNVDSVASNFGNGYWLYANRDNTPGYAFGADFANGHFTHSFHGSYEKFHNQIVDKTSGNNSIYNGIPGLAFYYKAQNLYSGPNDNAPQATFQSDKQIRYDGSWTKGTHNVRYGYSFNRIEGGGFASFFGLGPRAQLTPATLLANCGGVAGAVPCPNDPLNGYHVNTLYIGNGQGSFTENPGFGMAGGGVGDWRQGAYITDSWKVVPSFTLIAGLRWSVDTGRANQDLATPLCSSIDPTQVTAPCTGSTPIFSLFDPSLGAKVHQPYGNFGPQLGFAYSPGNHNMVIHAGVGIFYEGDVFNNTTNARSSLLQSGAFNIYNPYCSNGVYSVPFADGTTVSSINGTSIKTLCGEPISQSGPAFVALQKEYEASAAAHPNSPNGSYVGNTLTVNNVYGAPYRTPYSEQWNAGVQKELFKGAIISVDYVHNSTLKVGQQVDKNHVGAARFLNTTAAQNAIAATTAGYNCTGGYSAAAVDCAIQQGASILDFAGSGLDSGNQYLGGSPASYVGNGLTPDTGAAFAGANPALGNGNFILPIGRSGYDALQIVYKQATAHPAPGIERMNVQVSYSLSRVVSSYTAGTGGNSSDQFFSGLSWDNDNPNQYMGRSSLDHTNQLSMGGSFIVKHGPTIALLGHFYSAPPASLTLDSTNTSAGIFQSDLTGDGTIGDLAPGTEPGDYMHRIKGNSLGKYINNFNASQAGQLTPAGKALVASGLLTRAQLINLGGVVQQIATLPQATALNNPAFRSLDMSFSYPVHLNRLREGLSLEPVIAFYNVANFSNFTSNNSGVLLNTTNAQTLADPTGLTNQNGGYLSGLNNFSTLNANRNQRGSGTFDQGAARSTEFQLKLNF